MRSSLLVLVLSAAVASAAPPSAIKPFAALDLPPSITKPLLQKLLQKFVDHAYKKGFRYIGDERDFDHGHLLLGPDGRTPVAILYHTQELAFEEPARSSYSFIDPGGRNWLQWIGDGRVQNAANFVRKDYPKTASWAWFVAEQLPSFQRHHTIIDKMLDPAAVGADTERSMQWVFTRRACGQGKPSPDDADIQVRLPEGDRVCLALSRS